MLFLQILTLSFYTHLFYVRSHFQFARLFQSVSKLILDLIPKEMNYLNYLILANFTVKLQVNEIKIIGL